MEMKEIDLASEKKKLYKNHAIAFSDGESILLEFFCRMNMLLKTEHAVLCERLLENEAFKKYLEIDKIDTEDYFADDEEDAADEDVFQAKIKEKKEKNNLDPFVQMMSENITDMETEPIDVPIPLMNRKMLENFKNVCHQMQSEGYLKGIDLPKALMIVGKFNPSMVLKAYEVGYWSYDFDTAEVVSSDISMYAAEKERSSLPSINKIMVLSSVIYATINDLRSEGKEEAAEKMQISFNRALKGIPEFFAADAIESLNRRLSSGTKTQEQPFIHYLSSFMAKQQKDFFEGEYLTLEETVELNDAIHQIETLKAENFHLWKQKARPIFAQMLKYVPQYVREDFLKSYIKNLADAEKTFYDTRLDKDNWQINLINSLSKCYNYNTQDYTSYPDVLKKMQELKVLANKSISINPSWTMGQKVDFFDVCCDFKIEDIQKRSTHHSKGKTNDGRCYE
jgi:hypothetical protein